MRSVSRSSAGFDAPVGDQPPGVLVELVLGGDDRSAGPRARLPLKIRSTSVGPAAEQLPVLLRRAEQLADDRDRVRLADVDGDVGPPGRRDGVDEPVDTSRMNGRSRSAARGENALPTSRRSRVCSSPSADRIDVRCRCEVLRVGDALHLHDLATSRCASACRAASPRRRRSAGSRSRTGCGRSSSAGRRPQRAPRSRSPVGLVGRGRAPGCRDRTLMSMVAPMRRTLRAVAGARRSAASGSTNSTPRNSATGALVTWPPTVLTPRAMRRVAPGGAGRRRARRPRGCTAAWRWSARRCDVCGTAPGMLPTA